MQDVQFFKSPYSETVNCVEVAILEDGVLIRHSKMRSAGALRFTDAEWKAFIAGVKDDVFDV